LNAKPVCTRKSRAYRFGVQIIGLRRAELVGRFLGFDPHTSRVVALVTAGLHPSNNSSLESHKRFMLRFCIKSPNIALRLVIKTLFHAKDYDSMLFSGAFGDEPDSHSDILDIDDLFLKYASSEKIDGHTLVKLSPESGVAFLTIRRNEAIICYSFHFSN
jgi:hypothetical protein